MKLGVVLAAWVIAGSGFAAALPSDAYLSHHARHVPAVDVGGHQALGLLRNGQSPPNVGRQQRQQEMTWFRTVAEFVLMLLVGGVVGAAVGGCVMCVMSRRKAKEEDEAEEAQEPQAADGQPPAARSTGRPKASRSCGPDLRMPLTGSGAEAQTAEQLMAGLKAFSARIQPEIPRLKQLAAQRARDVGDNTKAFVCCELEDVCKVLRSVIDESDASLMLEWDTAVEANLPPMSVVLAGSLSPLVLSTMLTNHALQFFVLFLPVSVLCLVAMIMDANAEICVIPSLRVWLGVGGTLAFLLAISHGAMMVRILVGQSAIAKKAKALDWAIDPSLNGPRREPSTREVFMRASVLLQTAAHLQHDVQTSIWYNINGACTFFWLPVTTWVTVLAVFWTFYPGTIAFHPDVAKAGVADAELCEARWTVFAARVTVMLASLFWLMHSFQVFGWIVEVLVHNKNISDKILRGAQDLDNSTAMGFPYAEIFVRAFIIHGDRDFLRSKLSVASAEQMLLEHEKEEMQRSVDALDSKLKEKDRRIAALHKTAEERGGASHAAQVEHLQTCGVRDLAGWKQMGSELIHKADEDAALYRRALQERSPEEHSDLQCMVDKINELMEQVQTQVNAGVQAARGGSSSGEAAPALQAGSSSSGAA